MSAYLDIDRIEVSYGPVTALHSLSLAIGAGEFFCLLGPSGCGKTTTLNVVAGFIKPTAGRVLLAGQDVTSLPSQRRRIGVVFQNYALFPHMTVADNVGYGLKIQKRSRAEIDARVAELLTLVRLDGKSDRYPKQLSGGEQQRVAIARALAIEPSLLLLDEPLSNLDARLREEMRTELKRIQRATGVTAIFVTHDQEEAFGIGDRIAVMNQGRLEQLGTPGEIYGAPQTTFVAKFIGRSNTLRGTLEPATGLLRVNGHTFRCAKPAAAPGGPHNLYLRPETMRLGREPQGPNSVPGKVVETVYGGTLISYKVASEIGEFEVAQLGDGRQPFQVGEPVHVGWPADAGALLPVE